MLFYQLEYTSCRVGEHAGFQVSAASPGIETLSQADMDEVIRLGYYRPPEKIAAPQAFRAVRLTSGRQLLQYSRYLGCDDTGREGNFLTHSLVSHATVTLPAWAMDYAHWSGKFGGLTAQDQNSAGAPASTPQTLPPIRMSNLTDNSTENLCPSNTFSHVELAAFVLQHKHRADWLCFMLALLFLPMAGRRLAVRDEASNLCLWLACLTKLLPRTVANTLALSTRQPEAGGFDVFGLSQADPAVTRAGLNMVDVSETAPPELPVAVPASARAYARKVVELLLRRPEAVPGFLQGLGGIIRRR